MNKKNIPEYRAWKAMKARCYSPCNSKSGKYQQNKIAVCKRWIDDFDQFFIDMGPRPSKKHSLDRINNLGDYTKDNCRWATAHTQAKNRAEFNKNFTFDGKTMVLKDWAKYYKIKYTTLYQRVFKQKIPFEKAITIDVHDRIVEIDGKRATVKQWCDIYRQNYANVISRIHRGWKKVDAIITPLESNRKLDEQKVIIIKKMIAEGDTNKTIAQKFNIDQSVISRIKHGKAWSNVG